MLMSRPTYTIRDDQASVAVQLGRWIAELTEERDRLLAENAANASLSRMVDALCGELSSLDKVVHPIADVVGMYHETFTPDQWREWAQKQATQQQRA
jgi:hypothetical protein